MLASGDSLLSIRSTACMVIMLSPPGCTTEICMLDCVLDAAGVFLVSSEMDAVVSMTKAV
jgi:hypothetical protein